MPDSREASLRLSIGTSAGRKDRDNPRQFFHGIERTQRGAPGRGVPSSLRRLVFMHSEPNTCEYPAVSR